MYTINNKQISFKHPIHFDCNELLNGFYKLYDGLIEEGDFGIDVGSAAGCSSLIMGLLAGIKGKIIIFEPSKAFTQLTSNLQSNTNISNFDCYNIGVLDEDKECDLISSPSYDNSGIIDREEFSIEERPSSGGDIYKTSFVNLNDFLAQKYSEDDIKKIKFIKIDAEGVDYKILRSIKPLLEKVQGLLNSPDKLFDAIEYVNYVPCRPDNFKIATRDQFNNKTEDLILLPK